jgi:hypothetical protein
VGGNNALGEGRPLDKFDVMQMYFASGSAEKKALFEELVDEKI